jgi:hypothetical protein
MISKMSESKGKVLGFKLVGDITKEDFKIIVPEVQALVDKEESISLLLDMTQFKWEDMDAWGDDFNFNRKYRKKINKIAIIGNKTWEKWLTKLVEPFYHSAEAKFFNPIDIEAAWKWVKE